MIVFDERTFNEEFGRVDPPQIGEFYRPDDGVPCFPSILRTRCFLAL